MQRGRKLSSAGTKDDQTQHESGRGRGIIGRLFDFDFEGRPGMSDVTLLSGISGLSFESPFLSPLLFFFSLVPLLFLSCRFSANGPFS